MKLGKHITSGVAQDEVHIPLAVSAFDRPAENRTAPAGTEAGAPGPGPALIDTTASVQLGTGIRTGS